MSSEKKLHLLVFCYFIFAGIGRGESTYSYDYSSTIECLENPHKPQYNGGIIVNPELNDGLKGWSTFGGAKVEHRQLGDNKFIIAHSRNHTYGSVSQKIYLEKDKLYTFSAWIQITDGMAPITAMFKTNSGFKYAGAVVAESKCWSFLKGGLTVDQSGLADLYFESKNTSVEIWVDSISLQPFTEEQWRSHQDESIEKVRKRKVRIQALDSEGNPLANASVSIKLNNRAFPFGSAINKNILNNPAYQKWFTSRFTVTTFENEMKWYTNEPSRGKVDYSAADALIRFSEQHKISVRGHNVLWNDPSMQPQWVKSLSGNDFLVAVVKRINSVMKRYKGKVIGWDVLNEDLHFNFFESKIGPKAAGIIHNLAIKADPTNQIFINDYNTIEEKGDGMSTPAKVLLKIQQIKSYPGNAQGHFGIGLEGHFDVPNPPYIRASLDTLGAAKFPIWITELDVKSSPSQAKNLEQALRELHGHPKVNGIVMWTAWSPQGCYRMCLTDNNFRNLPTGTVVDNLLKEWGSRGFAGKTDSEGFFDASLFHGDYVVEISQYDTHNSSLVQNLNVAQAAESDQTPLHLTFSPLNYKMSYDIINNS